MAQWYKMHEGRLEDSRLAFIAKRLSVKRTAVQATWWLAWDIASKAPVRGAFSPDSNGIEQMAFVLDEDIQDVERIVAEFKARGMVQNGLLVEWAEAQRMSTAGAKRQAKYRDALKKKLGDMARDAAGVTGDKQGDGSSVTSDGENVTGDENSGEEEENQNQNPPIPPASGGEEEGDDLFQEFWKERPGRGKAPDSEFAAEREWLKLTDSEATPEELLRAIQGYAAWCREEGKAGTKHAKQVSTFLHDGTWRQYAHQVEAPKGSKAAPPEPLPEWQEALVKRGLMQPGEVSFWFKNARLDGSRLVFTEKFCADKVRQNYDQAVRLAFGKVEIVHDQGRAA